MKVALVYDRITKWGGAERVLLALHDIWPDAPLYTAVYDPIKAPWAHVFDVRTSFLQHVPFAKTHHELYPWLTPLAFESFSFDRFDLVISVTSAEAKDIITKPATRHVCYCLTPTRYLWSGLKQYQLYPGTGLVDRLSRVALTKMGKTLRRWDKIGGSRPDYYIAISHRVEKRIREYYERKPIRVIYPPVDLSNFRAVKGHKRKTGDYFLVVSRLVGYKRVDIIIDAFNRLGLPLVIIGDGRARSGLESRAGDTITFISKYLTDKELVSYYENCRAVVTAADEDFGLSAVEANAAGRPVIAYKESGVSEIIQNNITGVFFDEQNFQSLTDAIDSFNTIKFDTMACVNNASRFKFEQFTLQMKQTLQTLEKHT